jgi:hypothetical protein
MSQPNTSAPDPTRALLRHTLATVAYRGGKALRHAPSGFADFDAGHGLRTPGKILAHIADLFDWALSIAQGEQKWINSEPLTWDRACERFFASLKKFDDFLASSNPLQAPPERLFQAPIADALTHIGQIGMLRRMAGSPVKGENFFIADIAAGRVGPDQPAPKFEF